MEIAKWISWFVIGLLAAIIHYKKYRTKEDIDNKTITTEILLFIWGWIGMFFIFMLWLTKKYFKKD